ncbi:MAG: peptidyl-prolyl cis-trans isomerase [Alphaproteobacteria bacterium]|nr:peptidyl-prolyl cis-trans isomerase [Alphaproteobacteria bacterium]
MRSSMLRLRNRALRLTAALAAFVFALAPAAPGAQEVMNIAAVVNDEVISIFDLRSRTRLIAFSAGLPDGPETRRRLEPQILRTLIDERLQLQEAKRLNISVGTEEIKSAFGEIEAQNGMPKGRLEQDLRRAGIDAAIVEAQIRAAISWDKVVRRQIRSQVQIGNDEVQEAIQRLKGQIGRPQSLINEIFLAVDSVDQEDQVRGSAGRLLEQIKSGAPFDAMARQFSQSSSAPQGGDLGWVPEDDLPDELRRAVENLKPGEISEPVRSVSGYHIMLVRERRLQQAPGAEEAEVSLRYIFFRAPPGASPSEQKSLVDLANLVRDNATDCADMGRWRQQIDNSPFPIPEKVKLKELSDVLRAIVADLPLGKASAPISVANGHLLVMVCERNEPAGIDEQRVESALYVQRIDIMLRRYMRDLRRAAFIDVRV